MSGWFDRLPIHRKLVLSALLVTAVALVILTAGLGIADAIRFRATAAADAGALAQVLAENTAAAVAFEDPDEAQALLQSMRVRALVTRACLYLPTGRLFAGYARGDLACPAMRPLDDSWRDVSGSAEIRRANRTDGIVIVERALSDLRDRLLLTSLAGLLMLGLAAFAAYLIAERVHSALSRPIGELARFARDFDADDPRDPPAIRTSPDELGELVSAFGGMVSRVRQANEALLVSNDALRREQAEREAALERERASERRFRMLADGSPVLLWVNGHDGCEFVNRAYLEFLGLASDTEVRGFDWARFVHPDDRDAYLEAYAQAYRSRTLFQAEFRFLRADGAWRWLRSAATPRFEHDDFAGYVGATVDITERRRAEDALREADQRKDAFIAILAHELRNPLAPIRTGLELLRISGDAPGAMARIRPVLERQVSHMVRLIDDLLDVSRITSGKIQLQRQSTRLSALVQSAVDANRTAIDAAGLHLVVQLPSAACVLDVDPTRFVQVLSNLLNNATKFTDRGGEIRIEASVDELAVPPRLALSVRDTGIGIAASTLPHVFEFFVQGSARGARSGLGIGLGLARQLIELHGGEITADSPGPGQGSVFTITLPVLTWDGVAVQPAPGERPTRRVDRQVLVIDDNVDAADMLTSLVESLGGTARAAYDGASGLALARDFTPDIVLLDIGMPGMDGYETCRRLRSEPGGRDAYVVAVTGWGQARDRERALSHGFDAHLTKPADPRALEDLLVDAPRRSPATADDSGALGR